MALIAQPSNFTMDNITQSLASSIGQMEQQLTAELTEISENPYPSEQDLIIFEANLDTWSIISGLETSIIKSYTETEKNIVTNIGS